MARIRKINLALQGGGAHGAFTWGVLDRLLEDESIEVAAISGTSAGALNAAAFKAGWMRDGRVGARERLDWLWRKMGALDDLHLPGWMKGLAPRPSVMSHMLQNLPAYRMAEAMGQVVSPYAYGPFYTNPLQAVVENLDFDHVCSKGGPELFIGATNVHSGKIRVFSGDEISVPAILASACLPDLFQAVEIDGEHYWDGGYTGNPALFPLFAPELPDDVVVVNINPLHRPEVPLSVQAIQNRINEISFNSSLLRELRAIDFVQRLLEDGMVKPGRMKRVLIHMIADDDLMRELSAATKMIPMPTLLAQLKEAGRQAADGFLTEHGHRLNRESSVDLRQLFS